LDEEFEKRQRALAKELRKSRWWQEQLQKPCCFYCNRMLTPQEATMDHVLPISQGGQSTKGNVVIACKTCNTKKSSLTIFEWEEYLNTEKKSRGV
jgi:5-methylcytosine-specific restriction endonuclease McrA